MMIEKYFGMDRETARALIGAACGRPRDRSGDNRFQNTEVFLIDEYAVLKMENMDFRNVTTPDPELKHLERLARELMDLRARGVHVVPILALQSDDGKGCIIQPRARGAELYDRDRLDDKDYVLRRVAYFSGVPQAHYDKFITDAIEIIDAGILIDSVGKDNFFYDESMGFQFIDLNAHADYEYGLSDERPQGRPKAFFSCYFPLSHCPYYLTSMPKCRDVVSRLLSGLTAGEHALLRQGNSIIYHKCQAAAANNGISEDAIAAMSAGHGFIAQMRELALL